MTSIKNRIHIITLRKSKISCEAKIQLSLNKRQKETQLNKEETEEEREEREETAPQQRSADQENNENRPNSLTPMLYRSYIQQTEMGLSGGERLYQLPKKRFYWPNMERVLKILLETSASALLRKKPRPMDIVGIDFLKVD